MSVTSMAKNIIELRKSLKEMIEYVDYYTKTSVYNSLEQPEKSKINNKIDNAKKLI